MKKRFNSQIKLWIRLVAVVALVISIVCIIINLLRLNQVGNFVSYNHPLDITATVVLSIVSIVLVIFAFCSGYSLSKKSLTYNLGVFFKSIYYQDIIMTRQDNQNTMLFVYYKVDKDPQIKIEELGLEGNVIQIFVDPKYFDNIVDAIKSNNKSVIIEIFGNDKKEPKNDDSDKQ